MMKLDDYTNKTKRKVKIKSFHEIEQNGYPRAWIIHLLIDGIEFTTEIDYQGCRYGLLHRVFLIDGKNGKRLQIKRQWYQQYSEALLYLFENEYGFYLETIPRKERKSHRKTNRFEVEFVKLNYENIRKAYIRTADQIPDLAEIKSIAGKRRKT